MGSDVRREIGEREAMRELVQQEREKAERRERRERKG